MPKKTISVLWSKHVDPSKKSDFEETIKNSKTALSRLSEIIDQFIEETDKREVNFEDPNWSHREAFLLGQKQAYKKIKNLIDL